jgi:hypothetical protein
MRGVDVRGGTVPGAEQASLVHDETEFATHNPPMIVFPFLAYLGRAASLPYGVDQRDALAVRHPQHRRRCQKAGVHAVWALKSRAKRVRSGIWGNNG